MQFLPATSVLILAPLILVTLCACAEAGYRLGRRDANATENHRQQTTTVQGALLGLLALLLGFSFAMASGRFDERQNLLLEEANAIGTLSMRTQLLAAPRQAQLVELVRSYARERLAFQRAGADEDASQAADARSMRLQPKMWGVVLGAEAETPAPLVASVIQGLNEMIDAQGRRRAAVMHHVPAAILWVLLLVTCVTCGFVGYGSGIGGRRHAPALGSLLLLLTAVIALVIDLDRPRRGLIVLDSRPLIELVESIDPPLAAGAVRVPARLGAK